MKYTSYLLGVLFLSSVEALKLSTKLNRHSEALAQQEEGDEDLVHSQPLKRIQLNIEDMEEKKGNGNANGHGNGQANRNENAGDNGNGNGNGKCNGNGC